MDQPTEAVLILLALVFVGGFLTLVVVVCQFLIQITRAIRRDLGDEPRTGFARDMEPHG